MKIHYGSQLVTNSLFLSPQATQMPPHVSDLMPAYSLLIMYDPDAVHGTYVHWIAQWNPQGQREDILSYQGPQPPQGTGIHRYIFVLYELPSPIDVNLFRSISRNTSLADVLKILGITSSSSSSSSALQRESTQFTSQFMSGGRTQRRSRRPRQNLHKRRKTRKYNTKNKKSKKGRG